MGRKAIDLTGQQFERLLVIERDLNKSQAAGKHAYWICRCSCGNVKSIEGSKLRQGIIHSCGCLQRELSSQRLKERISGTYEDLTGKRFGKLLVLEHEEEKSKEKKKTFWKCQCDCGTISYVESYSLKNGIIQSCGCTKSKGEQKIISILTQNGIIFKKEISFDNLKDKNKLRFDFGVFNKEGDLQYLIEFQGQQHYFSTDFFGGDVYLNKLKQHDSLKRKYCNENNILLIEIPYWDLEKLSYNYLLDKLGR